MKLKFSKDLVLNKSFSVGLFVILVFSIIFENTLIIYKEIDKKAIHFTQDKISQIINIENNKSIEDVQEYMFSCIEESIHPIGLPPLAGYKGLTESQLNEYADGIIFMCRSKHVNDAETPKEKKRRKIIWRKLI